MIQEFYVENFKSINKKQGISFIPNKKMNNGSEEYLLIDVKDGIQLLKLGILYGYNASGKSNLLDALNFLRELVLTNPESKDMGTGFDPFLLDTGKFHEPGRFTIIFYIDSVKYEYTISLNQERILTEKLSYTPDVRRANLYTRSYDEDMKVSKISFGKHCDLKAHDKLLLTGNTLENASVLSAYRRTNIHSVVLEKVSEYFRDHLLPVITPRNLLLERSFDRLIHDTCMKDYYLQLLKKADFQISDITIEEDSYKVTDEFIGEFVGEQSPVYFKRDSQNGTTIRKKQVFFSHSTLHGTFMLPSEKESHGTLRYFGLGGVLKDMISSSRSVFIDEIETSLHPDLVSFLLQQFLMNSKDSQLFLTTHSQFLMDLDFMRNDMLWLCEKDEDGQSNYFSVQDFKLHKNVSVINYYRAGKLGASPNLGNPVFLRNLEQ